MPLSYLVTSAAPPVTADQCWALHRQVLGGVSSVTGAPLPESITACPAGAQKAHFAFAVLVNLPAGREMPAPPPGLDDAEVEAIVRFAHGLLGEIRHGDVQGR